MKNRILALLIALTLLLTTAALAEDSTAYSLTIADPVIGMYGQELDLTGVAARLDLYLTDSCLVSMDAGVYSGGNHENVDLYVQAQFDETGLHVGAQNLAALYSIDPSLYTAGVDLYLLIDALNLRSATLQQPAPSVVDHGMLLQALYGGFITYAEDGVIYFEIDRSKTLRLISASDTPYSLEATGSVTPGEAGAYELSMTGTLYDESGSDAQIPFTLYISNTPADGTIGIYLSAMDYTATLGYAYATEIAEGSRTHSGYATLSLAPDADETQGMSLSFYLYAGAYDMDSSAWAIDTASMQSVAIDAMTQDELSTLNSEAGAIAQAGLAQLVSDVPMIGTLLGMNG